MLQNASRLVCKYVRLIPAFKYLSKENVLVITFLMYISGRSNIILNITIESIVSIWKTKVSGCAGQSNRGEWQEPVVKFHFPNTAMACTLPLHVSTCHVPTYYLIIICCTFSVSSWTLDHKYGDLTRGILLPVLLGFKNPKIFNTIAQSPARWILLNT